ncbi:DENN domain-containing protein 3 [Plakobranchus ocellatus]|uniref:DENN domain-containing protein 3 n=1 Tax=Plakobranchus ocellatus TaxID=259542 RepID=A0AAV4C2X4_9GAST|nr:DENN domain-containing protein 3 [Plakobranchus ocellatus]
MSVYNLSVSLFPSESPEKPVIDLPLHLTFLCFPVDDLLNIFTAILCEERLVFVSFNYALLTTIMEHISASKCRWDKGRVSAKGSWLDQYAFCGGIATLNLGGPDDV